MAIDYKSLLLPRILSQKDLRRYDTELQNALFTWEFQFKTLVESLSLGNMVAVLRVTGDTTLNDTHSNVFCDTDGGGITITLPAGVAGRYYRIINSGSSGNSVTITPDGTEDLLGSNSSLVLTDGQILILAFETTEGWW